MTVFFFYKSVQKHVCVSVSIQVAPYTDCVMLCNGLLEHVDVYSQ